VNGHAVFDRRKTPRLNDAAHDVGANFGQPIAQHAKAFWSEVGADTPTSSDTTRAAAMNARNKTQGDMPAAFMTMISESLDNLLSTCATAISNANRRNHKDQQGYDQAGDPDEDKDRLPLAVMMSMSRNACVTQITAVRLTSTIRNAPSVVRKMYSLMDPIRSIVP
jgi:hypothetical protein